MIADGVLAVGTVPESTSQALLFGAVLAVGVVAVLAGLRPPRLNLAQQLAELDRLQGIDLLETPTSAHPERRGVVARLASTHASARSADLAVVGRSPEAHAVKKLTTAVALLVMPISGGALTALAGVEVPWLFVGMAGAAFAVLAAAFVLQALARYLNARAGRR